ERGPHRLSLREEEGDLVEAGKTVLARIDDIWARLALEQQQAEWVAAAAELEYQKGELRRLEELFKAAAVTESELHQKQTQIAQLEAKLQQIQAAMAQEQERQKRSVVYAPFDGVVTAKQAELGQYVQPGSPLVEIISRGQIDAQLMVPESAVNHLRLGQTISIGVDPLGEEAVGKVVSITPFGPTASRTFPVRVRIEDPSGRLKVGMSITARIPTGPEKPALVVPKDAVLEKPDEAVVWVVTPDQSASQTGEVRPTPVTIDIRLPTEYAVTVQTAQGAELLKPGAQVVIEGGERLMPGQKVQIIP
ncbi:MAG TPA: efflux RND transporter periplasmic adaptor subunit, partial [Thermoguttaceae bacterium]|nr:efflux RND transporter periplasmic adaptor subunit [Thermoguttaceae bacterium]